MLLNCFEHVLALREYMVIIQDQSEKPHKNSLCVKREITRTLLCFKEIKRSPNAPIPVQHNPVSRSDQQCYITGFSEFHPV